MDSTRNDSVAAAVDDVELKQSAEAGNGNDLVSKDAAAAAPVDNTTNSVAAAGAVAKKKKKVTMRRGKCKKHGQAKRSGKQQQQRLNKKSSSRSHDQHSSSSSSSSSDDGSHSDSSGSDSDTDLSDQESSSSGNPSAEEKKLLKKLKELRKRRLSHRKKSSSKKHRVHDSSSSNDSDSDSDSSSSSSSSSEEEQPTRRKRHKRSSKKSSRKRHDSSSEDSNSDENEEETQLDVDPEQQNIELQNQQLQAQLQALQLFQNAQVAASHKPKLHIDPSGHTDPPFIKLKTKNGRRKLAKKKPAKRGSTLEYKRVDQLWDSSIHNYKLTESAEDQVDEFDEYIFTVRRKFDWENKYRSTVVDIKSKLLRDALQEVMKDVKGVSLVEEQPSIDPNMLFNYLEELRTHYKKTLKSRLKKEKKKKNKKKITLQISQCKVLVGYLDQDYDDVKKTLFPMLKSGHITFDLLWALFKPNTIAFTQTYGSAEDPRCFKVDYANKESSFIRGEWYSVGGPYLEYDGKNFGFGEFEATVEAFKGPRKITSLSTYPLQYHKDPEGLRKQLVERGKKFVALQGMNYRFHKGLAFQKKKKGVAKVNINGRVMIDPAIFRRINPNYIISVMRSKDVEDVFSDDDDDEDGCSACCESSSEEGMPDGAEGPLNYGEEETGSQRTKFKVVFDEDNKPQVVQVPVDDDGREIRVERLEKMERGGGTADGKKPVDFTEEDLLIASPVVLGFSFSEKLWLEFTLSGIRDIEWDENAFASLVIPPKHKDAVKAMVSSHKFHAAETIDDVVQGKGRGLVFVLHGPPGVGKTLTAEGIAEHLRCPLYAVSAGELGTDSRMLEHELQKIMDIAHSWGAVVLLDEADVFLERREVHDIMRNALVSIFLRLLEYFQGILFLTTNRVETFDDAFQSRIHMPLKYAALDVKARKSIWKSFVERVRVKEGLDVMPFKDEDFATLARHNLNGRQIKNSVRIAQSLAIHEKVSFSMEHIRRSLEVSENFENDLKGGTGYLDAMRSYT